MGKTQKLQAGVLAAFMLGPILVASAEEQATKRSTPLDWGLMRLRWRPGNDEHLDRTLAQFASKPQYMTFYLNLTSRFPKYWIEAIRNRGATSVMSLELWVWHDRRKESWLPDLNAGKFDESLFRPWAKEAKAYGKRILMRFGFEFNGYWFTWSHDPKAFVAAWRRAHDIFKEEGADNVEWLWVPNIVSCPDTPENDMHLYYPGDKYVDVIGTDGYNFGDHHDKWHKWESFEVIYRDRLADFKKRYPGKPVIIPEFGSAPGKPGQRAQWIREAHAYLQTQPQVKAAVWFNLDKRREGEPNWKLSKEDGSLQAFNETFARPRK